MPTIKDCLAHCARDARCVSVTHHPASSHCWLKFKQFGDRTTPLEGYNSANLGIIGDVKITNFYRTTPLEGYNSANLGIIGDVQITNFYKTFLQCPHAGEFGVQ